MALDQCFCLKPLPQALASSLRLLLGLILLNPLDGEFNPDKVVPLNKPTGPLSTALDYVTEVQNSKYGK